MLRFEEIGDTALAAAGWLRRRHADLPPEIAAEALLYAQSLERAAGVGFGVTPGGVTSPEFGGVVE